MDRFELYLIPSGHFGIGLYVQYGNCGNCEAFHFDVHIELGWVGMNLYLGERISGKQLGR